MCVLCFAVVWPLLFGCAVVGMRSVPMFCVEADVVGGTRERETPTTVGAYFVFISRTIVDARVCGRLVEEGVAG